MTKTVIYYFSGTGNSLYLARELAKRMPEAELIPLLRAHGRHGHEAGPDENGAREPRPETVGFVFPIHLTTVPRAVREAIETVDVSSARYVFAAATRGGTFTIAETLLRRLFRKKGARLDAYFQINMVYNTPTGIAPGKGSPKWPSDTGPERIGQVDRDIAPQIDRMAETVVAGARNLRQVWTRPLRYLRFLLFHPLTANVNREAGYRVDESCTACGICERVCPSGTVSIEDGRPVWQGDVRCYLCFACFNFCPEQAILVSEKYELKTGRYHHPGITAEDIAAQKPLPAR